MTSVKKRPVTTPSLGIVRPARRPPGWIAPGPKPNTELREDLVPAAGEDLCFLAGDFRIFQKTNGHRWSADDLFTAHFAIQTLARSGSVPRRAVDLGCGIGTVLLFTAWRYPECVCTGIEAQEVSAHLAERSIAWNGLTDRCSVKLGDLRELPFQESLQNADLVTGTPPYLPVGSGPESSRAQCGPCRFEHRGGIEEYALAAANVMGRCAPFVACAAGFQRKRVERAALGAGLVLSGWKDVFPKPGKPALFSVFSMHKPHAGVRFVEQSPLYLRGENDRFTVEHDLARHELGIPVER
ncbi:MAG: SAM-dependent methyltransferase [Polyangiaceae bacterium]|nr:SAM-dependent methyltransferase [Polyangiaceae bacterium]